ncbi:MAG: DUF3298 domain-containing protein, partial [Bacillota bacterium]
TASNASRQQPEKSAADDIVLSDRYFIKQTLFAPNRDLSITYPIIKGMHDQAIEDRVNSFLKDALIPKEMLAVTSNETLTYGYRQEFKVSLFKKNLLNLEVFGYQFPKGAAHGMPIRNHYHLDLTTGKFYDLTDLFLPQSDYVQRLSAMVRDQIKQDAWPLISQSLELYKGVAAKQPFSLTADAIELYFTPYEIAPYAAGFPTFAIPYDSIGDMIDTNGALWRSFNDAGNIPSASLPDFQGIMEDYETALVEAINENNFALLELRLFPYSSLYDAQKKLVPDLFRKAIKERFEGCEVVGYERIPGAKSYRLHVRERIAIQYPGEQFVTKQFEYAYTVKYMPGERGYQLSDIERWTN